MEAGRPSKTAENVALARAAHQILDTPTVFYDPLALPIIGCEAEAALRANLDWHREKAQRRLRAFLVARGRFSEDALKDAIARGTDQYVVLGAGLDTSAYRVARSFPALRMFEIDHPATQAWKRQRLAAANIAVPSGLSFVPVDFERETLTDGLAMAGFDFARAGQIGWLGVLPYLTRAAIDATLEFVAGLSIGTEIVFDYSEIPREEGHRAAFAAIAARLSEISEPLRTQLDPVAFRAEVLGLGFSRAENFDTGLLGARYFAGRSDGFELPKRGYIMQARV